MIYAKTTPRAYTMRLQGDRITLSQLFKTHKAINAGAQAFGELILTLRGGLSASLANQAENLQDGMVMLALGWFSVEAPVSAVHPEAVVALASDPPAERGRRLTDRLLEILKVEGVAGERLEEWFEACKVQFHAEIREDSAWVDRRLMFDSGAGRLGWTSNDAESFILNEMMGPAHKYLAVKDEDSKAMDYAIKARGWLSRNWGTGPKSDWETINGKLRVVLGSIPASGPATTCADVLANIHRALGGLVLETTQTTGWYVEQIVAAIGWTKRKSTGRLAIEGLAGKDQFTSEMELKLRQSIQKDLAKPRERPTWSAIAKDPVETAVGMKYSSGRDNIGEYSVMLDHALRRVSVTHSWIRRAEVSRRSLLQDESVAHDPVVSDWVEHYVQDRTATSGSLDEYVIRMGGLGGWREVSTAWAELGTNGTPADRVRAARGLQKDVEKFGDIHLFEALAGADKTVWMRGGRAEPELLIAEVRRRIAKADQSRLKVPAFRHPDAFLSPVYCDYGKSRPDIEIHGHQVSISTIGSQGTTKLDFRWQSKRFDREIMGMINGSQLPNGSRNHPQARAAMGVSQGQAVSPHGIAWLTEWNGRLQAPRRGLEKLDRMSARGAPVNEIEYAASKIPWYISFSAPLHPQGPWLDFARTTPLIASAVRNPVIGVDAWPGKLANPKFEAAGLSFPFDHPDNGRTRKKEARIRLSRLPGLRVLSVDLGHRHAAACAVWETLSSAQIADRITAAGAEPPSPDSLYLHLAEGTRKRIYRRIGDDILPDGTQHPAPWALLDRQFTLPLPGEDKEPRYATNAERTMVHQIDELIEESYVTVTRKNGDWRMDRLQSSLIRRARLGLARHATMARLALGLVGSERRLPGGRVEPITTTEGRVRHLIPLLAQMHRLIMDLANNEPEMVEYWRSEAKGHIPHEYFAPIGRGGPQIRLESFAALAEVFAAENGKAEWWARAWKARWERMDPAWPKIIRRISRIIHPRGAANNRSLRSRGGLSLSRVTAIEEFRRKVQVAYYTRQKLDGSRAELPPKFSGRMLRKLERLRDTRVKLIASKIAGAALGIGADPSKGHPTCHAVVIEDLKAYRPDGMRTRMENRRLMSWSSARIRKLLAEACQLSGLHLREVSPSFTSRQDSRTGSGGVRAVEISVLELRKEGGYWNREVSKARDRIQSGRETSADRILVAAFDRLGANGRVYLPRPGGSLFISSNPAGPLTLQADLNAAANIGLAALLDPDWDGRWWFVLAGRGDHVPDKELSGAAPLCRREPLTTFASTATPRRQRTTEMARHFREMKDVAEPIVQSRWFVGFPSYEADILRRVESRIINAIGDGLPW